MILKKYHNNDIDSDIIFKKSNSIRKQNGLNKLALLTYQRLDEDLYGHV